MIILSTFVSSSFLFFFVSLVKTMNAFSVISTIVGSLIGFLMGIYVPMGSLPPAVQFFIKIFPPSHSASILRQIMVNEAFELQYVPREVTELLGIHFYFGDTLFPLWASLLVLFATAVLFFGLSVIVTTKRKRNS